MTALSPVLVVACGALARELIAVIRAHGWTHVSVQCLPADYHNTPVKIPSAVDAKLSAGRGRFSRMFVAYADCGTGGALDAVLARHGAERLPGPHCYANYAGQASFADMMDDEPGTFFLTDFLARHFDRVVYQTLGLDRYPELVSEYFGNYRKLVYLSQVDDAALEARARAAAARLGLAYEHRRTGLGEVKSTLVQFAMDQGEDACPS